MSIPALDRGLRILDYLIRSGESRSHGRIGRDLGDIPESSLNRLLKSLVATGHVERDERGGYGISSKVEAWRMILTRRADVGEVVRRQVAALSEATDESAAFAMLKGERIEIIHSVTRPESIGVMKRGGTLRFEWDHAAALAIMNQLSDDDVQRVIASPLSEIGSRDQLDEGMRKAEREGVFADRSLTRLGVSRIATGLFIDDAPAALFLCLPTARMEHNFHSLREALLRTGESIRRQLS